MSSSVAPALYANAMPSPVHIRALVVGSNARPIPPVAKITALAVIACIFPVSSSIATTPLQIPSSIIKSVTNHSSYERTPDLMICSYITCNIAWPVISATKNVLA